MKKSLLYLLFILVGFKGLAQCPFNNSPTFGGSSNNNVSNLTLGTRSILYETMWGGEYYEITNVPAGAQYRIDFCDAPFDTYMTLFPSDSSTPLAFNDNFCGTGGTRSQLEYTFATGGSYRIQLNEKSGGNNCLNGATNAPLYITLLYAPATTAAVNSIVRAASSPTNANSVSFTVTFSAMVTGLTASNFGLTTTGVSGATIGSVTGSGTTWIVTVNTGSGDGTIKLNVVNDTGLTPNLSNEPFDSGETYIIDKAPPTMDISSTINSPTNTNPIPLTFTASEDINGLVIGDVSVTNGTINNFSGSGANYTANLIPSSNGTVSVTINANSFNDLSGNANADPSSFIIQYDNISPAISTISRNNPTTQNTAASSVTFRATFTETVTGVDISDFLLTTTGTVTGNIASVTPLGGFFYAININNITGTGIIRLDLKGSGTGIADNSGNSIISGFTAGQTYIINNAPSFVLTSPQSLNICQSSTSVDLDDILRITDFDNAQNLTWSVVTNPLNGALDGFDYTITSNGSIVTTVGLGYTPNSVFVGNDNFTIRVSDGISTVEMTLNITVTALPNISINTDLTLCEGNSINLTSSGGGDYAWSGPNSFTSSIQNPIINSSTLINAGVYTLTVTNNGCSATSTTNVTVNILPSMPLLNTQYVCSGGNLTLTATCTGGANPIWFIDALGMSTISPVLSNVVSGDTFYVACQLNNCLSQIIPQEVSINQVIPYIYSSIVPDDVYGCENGDVLIPLGLEKTMGIFYQWQVNTGTGFNNLSSSSIYDGVNSDTLKISGISSTMANFKYRAIISNACSSIESDTFNLAVNLAPSITTSPTGQVVCIGNRIIMTMQASGTGISYLWQVDKGSGFEDLVNDQNYENANSPQLTIKDIPASFNNYSYRCQVFNNCFSIFTNPALLQVDPTVTILAQPINKTVCQNNITHFSVSAVHIGGGSISFQWQISYNGTTYTNLSNNATYQGVTSNTLTLNNIQIGLNNAKYRCLLNNYCRTVDAVLSVIPVVTINTNPTNVTICQGNYASFTAAAVGQGLTYRWQVNSGSGFVNIYDGGYHYQGATEATLRVYNALTTMNGYQYRCVVSGMSTCDIITKETNAAILNISASAEAQTIIAISQITTGNIIYQATEYVLGINKVLPPAKAEYRAGNAILLNPGFEVEAGAVFTAKIQNPCNLTSSSNLNLPKTITK